VIEGLDEIVSMSLCGRLIKFLFLCGLLGFAHFAYPESKLHFYYFNPDSPQHNLGQLKSEMDTLLAKLDLPLEFQPFARLTDFRQRVKTDHPSFVFAPQWYVHQYARELGFEPLLQSERNAQVNYRKLLIKRLDSTEAGETFSNTSLAMTSLGPESIAILQRIIDQSIPIKIESLNIVEVPKDADAVFAVALGQVEVALVSQASLLYLQHINPRLFQSLQVIGESKPLAMPILGYLDGASTKKQQEAFKRFMISTRGSTVMRALQIDGWSNHDD
jgi:hypothetical protein